MANRVFEDRLGVIVINSANVPGRVPGFRALGIKDLFFPRTADPAHLAAVRAAGLYAHLWTAVDGLSATDYANRTLLDIQRLAPGACELNIELPSDPPLKQFITDTVRLIRTVRPLYRLRVNLAPWKAFALAGFNWVTDPNLYVCEQNYEGNMDNLLSAADVLQDLLSYGVPPAKATVCYAAHCQVLGSPRLRTLPNLSRVRRGTIFSDDLLADAGLL